MNSNSRACIAYVAASLCGAHASYVYDYSQSKYINMSGSVDSNNVHIYDYDRGCYVSGSLNNLYDYGNRAYIELSMRKFQFSGYDYHTGSYFSGEVKGNSVSVYDYETSSYYNYSV